ncbi:MAG TPA: virulence-associated E family protein [Nitrospiraceae bacterium]
MVREKVEALEAKRGNGHGEGAFNESVADGVSLSTLWRAMGLHLTEKGLPLTNEFNAIRIISEHERWLGRIWWDTFHKKLFVLDVKTNCAREWTDSDDLEVQVWLQGTIGLRKIGLETVRHSITAVGHRMARDEPADHLRSIKWDGTDRIDLWMTDKAGAVDSPYSRAVSRSFWCSLAARILFPGHQVDTMVVFEGGQGIGKSSLLRVVGGAWYGEMHDSVTSREFPIALSGKALIEISELSAFSKAETARIKGVISCPVDRIRMPYDARANDWPRRCIFAGTTNDDSYLKDPTGGRRFLPITCGEIRLDLAAEDRDQCLAEAVVLVLQSNKWWEVPDAWSEQEAREQADPWLEIIEDTLLGKSTVTMGALILALEIPKERQHAGTAHRIGEIMRKLKWIRRRSNGKKFWEYRELCV